MESATVGWVLENQDEVSGSGIVDRDKRVLMAVPNSQLTTNFEAKFQLITIFLANSQSTTKLGKLLTFTFQKRLLFRHNPNFLCFSTSITSEGRPHYKNQDINLHELT